MLASQKCYQGFTPLHYAALSGNKKAVEWLEEKAPKETEKCVNAVSMSGDTVMGFAETKNDEVVNEVGMIEITAGIGKL